MRLTIQSASALRAICLMLLWREETDLPHSRSSDEHAEICSTGDRPVEGKIPHPLPDNSASIR